jgi:hypothetical protein
MRRTIAAPWVLASGLACTCPAIADDTYRAELGLDYYRFDSDSPSFIKGNATGVSATYYFDELPIAPRDYPFDQAPFVERAASATATYHRGSSEFDNFETLRDGSDVDITLIYRRPDRPLFATVSYAYSDGGKFRSRSSNSEFEFDTESYELALGAYAGRNTLLALDWNRRVTETKNTSSIGSSESESVTVSIGLVAQHLAPLGGGQHVALTAVAAQDQHDPASGPTEKNNRIALQATYYPTTRLGLSVGYAYNSGDDRFAEGETFLAGVKWYLTPAGSLYLNVQQTRAKEPNLDSDVVFLGGSVRF